MAALEVLPDLLRELDGTPPAARLTALVEGCLAANIFDWGAKACVDLYHNGTILEIYRCGARLGCGARGLCAVRLKQLPLDLLHAMFSRGWSFPNRQSHGSLQRPRILNNREARTKLSRRPWRVDTFDALAGKWFSLDAADDLPAQGVPRSPFRRVIMFVDNAGALPAS